MKYTIEFTSKDNKTGGWLYINIDIFDIYNDYIVNFDDKKYYSLKILRFFLKNRHNPLKNKYGYNLFNYRILPDI